MPVKTCSAAQRRLRYNERRLSPNLIDGCLHMDDAVTTGRPSGHILVVDDDPATRRMVISYLQEHDLRASAAANGREVTQHLAAGDPSLIILDLRLGREDGLDILRGIRHGGSDVPVIITTGHRLDEVDRVVGLELGADDYITKPFGLRELLARVRAVLRRHEAGRTARTREAQNGG